MQKGITLTEQDIKKYRLEIDEIDLTEKDIILSKTILKITDMFTNKNIEQVQLVLLKEINGLYNIINKNPNLEETIQQKILFAFRYFLFGQDDIPDDIPIIGFVDDLAVVDWVIQDIKQQYSKYFLA